jgi:hypothetical protein
MGLALASTVPTLSAPTNWSAINKAAANSSQVTKVKECTCAQPTRTGRDCLKYVCK